MYIISKISKVIKRMPSILIKIERKKYKIFVYMKCLAIKIKN